MLCGQHLADRLVAAGDPPAQVGLAGRLDQCVQLGQAGDLGDGDQVISAKASDLALDPALLVGAGDPRPAEERGVEVVGAHRDEAVGFLSAATAEDLDDRGLEVVVADLGGDAAEEGEGVGVALEEGELGLPFEGLDPDRARVG